MCNDYTVTSISIDALYNFFIIVYIYKERKITGFIENYDTSNSGTVLCYAI